MTITNSVTGGVTPYRIAGGQATGAAPATGTWVTNDVIVDSTGYLWICTAGGSPGTWVQANQTMVGVLHATGGTDTSGASTFSTPAPSSGSAFTISATQNSMLYITQNTAASITSITIGPSTGAEHTVVSAITTAGKALFTILVPAGWKVVITATIADMAFSACTC